MSVEHPYAFYTGFQCPVLFPTTGCSNSGLKNQTFINRTFIQSNSQSEVQLGPITCECLID